MSKTKRSRKNLVFLVIFIRSLFGDDIKVILLKEAKIFTGLAEFTLFHTLSDIPVDISPLAVHHVVLLAQSVREHSVDGNIVSDHDSSPLGTGDIVIQNASWFGVIQTNLESGWAPLDEADLVLLLHPLDGGVRLLGLDGTSIVEGDGHVLVFDGVEVRILDEEVSGLEGLVGDITDGVGVMVLLLLVDNRGEAGGHEVKTRERNQVGLELIHVDVQFTLESKGSGHGRHNLRDQSVEVLISWLLDIKSLLADIIDGLVIQNEGHLSVVQEPMGGEKSIVWLDDGGGDVGGRIDFKSNLGLLPVVNSKTLKDEHSHSGSGSSSNSVLDDESLNILRVVDHLSDSVIDSVHQLFSDGVVTTGEVVGSIFLAVDEEFRMVDSLPLSTSNVIEDGRLKVNSKVPWNVLSSVSLFEESLVAAVLLVTVILSLWVNGMLRAILFPDSVSKLVSSLSNRDGEDFTS